MALDLSTYSDVDVLRALEKEQPQFVGIVRDLIARGRTDEEIVRIVAMADGSGQVMRYTKKLCRALRSA